MRHWAANLPQVQFLEACVESDHCAVKFHRTFGFGANPEGSQHSPDNIVVNCWIPSRHYMPVGYGQLGCSGFVVVDAQGRFVSRKTASYLQYGQEAFRHVESILAGLLEEMEEEKKEEDETGKAPVARVMDRDMSDLPLKTTQSPQPAPAKKPTRKRTAAEATGTVPAPAAGASSPISVMDANGVMQAPSSVGVQAMDDEHQICTDSFNRALKDPTLETLQEVFDLLLSHFAHEEELMAKHAVQSPHELTSPFSAFVSHRKDHLRMLNMARQELVRVSFPSQCGPTG